MVDRARLFRQIEAQGDCALVWLSGPPGAGKTTLASTWLSRRRIPALWFRLDEADADPATFFSYLAQAAGATARGRRFQLPAFTPEFGLDLPAFTRRFFRQLFAALPGRAALVLDAYENAQGEALDHLLAIAVAEAPPGLRIVVTSRGEPPARLLHLASTGAMARVAWEDLRLTAKEAAAIARHARGRAVVETAPLLAESDGWVAGFVVLLQDARQAGLPGPQRPALRESMFGYFANEMFAHADEATRAVLLRTALLPSFTAAQAQGLCPDVDAPAVVQRIFRQHYFLDRSDTAEPEYRYHALFREFLLARGRFLLDASTRSALLAQAAWFLEASDQAEPALNLLLEAGAWDEAARVVCALAPGLLAQGRHALLDDWIVALPDTMLQAVPWLGYWLGMARMPFAPAAARELLEAAHARFQAGDDTTGRLLCCAGILETYWIEWGDVRPIDRWAAEIEAAMDREDAFPNKDVELRVLASLGGLFFRMAAQAALTHKATSRAKELLRQADDRVQRLMLAYFVFWGHVQFGNWRKHRALIDAYAEESRDENLPVLLQTNWYVTRAATSFVSGRFAESEAELEQGLAFAHMHGVRVVDAQMSGQGAYYALCARSPVRARAWLERMKASLQPSRHLEMTNSEHIRAAIALQEGRPAEALQIEQAALERTMACGSDFAEAFHRIGLAMALIELDRTAEAIAEAERVLAFSAAVGHPMFEYSGLLLKALALHKSGDIAAALHWMQQGFACGREHEQLVCGWLYPQILDTLCPLALRESIEVNYVRTVVRRLNIPAPEDDIPAWPWRVRIRALGRFSIEVDDAPVAFGRKMPKRPLSLLQFLVARGGETSAAGAMDALWPDEDGDAAAKALGVALHRVRELLGDAEAVELQGGELRLNRHSVWVDAFAFERALAGSGTAGPERTQRVSHALALYRGHLLPADAAEPWSVSARERLRARFAREALAHGRALEARRDWEEAAAHYARCIDLDDLAETLYQGQMRCQLALGRHAEGLAVYRRLERTLGAELGLKPSPASDFMQRKLREPVANP